MPIFYVDEVQRYGTGLWSHMWTDGTDAELDAFAKKIGLKGVWAQTSHSAFLPGNRFYHYDLKPSKRNLAVYGGAVEVSLHDYIKQQAAFQKLVTSIHYPEAT